MFLAVTCGYFLAERSEDSVLLYGVRKTICLIGDSRPYSKMCEFKREACRKLRGLVLERKLALYGLFANLLGRCLAWHLLQKDGQRSQNYKHQQRYLIIRIHEFMIVRHHFLWLSSRSPAEQTLHSQC